MTNSLFDNPVHEQLTTLIASTYEHKVKRAQPFYTPTPFWKLPLNCQQEHADIARAALTGNTINGQPLPKWVTKLADSVKATTGAKTLAEYYN